ncbi:hypothetical protein Vretimale_1138 [Volvox reticuliferus]|uniref:Uncharacterized protein n=1 Tax=Volvox reticuliferus TaxID=1737510 RepID=A0A8J4CHV3_9CHLO|nr:hypothetical protein Vretifemale_10354 [Volvox reticuliferus]GIL95026.1 hypothetical protein Vretimale_1138 [Volvox reticuliferus]
MASISLEQPPVTLKQPAKRRRRFDPWVSVGIKGTVGVHISHAASAATTARTVSLGLMHTGCPAHCTGKTHHRLHLFDAQQRGISTFATSTATAAAASASVARSCLHW